MDSFLAELEQKYKEGRISSDEYISYLKQTITDIEVSPFIIDQIFKINKEHFNPTQLEILYKYSQSLSKDFGPEIVAIKNDIIISTDFDYNFIKLAAMQYTKINNELELKANILYDIYHIDKIITLARNNYCEWVWIDETTPLYELFRIWEGFYEGL